MTNAMRLQHEDAQRLRVTAARRAPTMASVEARGVSESTVKQVRSCPTPAALPPLAEGRDGGSAHSRAIGASVRTQAARPETGRVLPTPVTVNPSLPSAITAVLVRDDAGNRWMRLPEAWVANADLCCWVDAYDHNGDTYVAACRQRSTWTSGDTGFCSAHFVALLEVCA